MAPGTCAQEPHLQSNVPSTAGAAAEKQASSGLGASSECAQWKSEFLRMAMEHHAKSHAEISSLVLHQQRTFFDAIQMCPMEPPSSSEIGPSGANGFELRTAADGEDVREMLGKYHVGRSVVSSNPCRMSNAPTSTTMTVSSTSNGPKTEAALRTGSKTDGVLAPDTKSSEYSLLNTYSAVQEPSVIKASSTQSSEIEPAASIQKPRRGSIVEEASRLVSRQATFIKQDTVEGGGCFDTFVGCVILLNATLLIVSSEWTGWLLAVDLGIQKDDGTWQHALIWFEALEQGFTAFFILELLYQLYVQRRSFFNDRYNCIDASVVAINSAEMYILTPLKVSSLGHVTILRLLRMAKLIRTLRIIRTVKFFSGLRVLVRAVVASLVSLLWSMVLLAMFIVMGGLLMTKLIEEFIQNANNDFDVRLWCWTYYGTPLRAMYTMFEVTLSGCWPNYVRPLLADVSHLYGLFFLLYISFVVFAVIRVITAIFLKETLDAASNDASMLIADKMQKRHVYLKKLEAVFKHADISGDGELSADEFDQIMQDPTVKVYLSALELEVHESSLLFTLLDNGEGVISYDDFVQGVSRLKGSARALDLVALQLDMKKVIKSLDKIKNLEKRFRKTDKIGLSPAAGCESFDLVYM